MRKRLNFFIKLGIGLAFAVAIGYQLLLEKDTEALWDSFQGQWSSTSGGLVIAAVVMMPLCWLIEAVKWKVLMRPALRISIFNSLKAVLGGVAISLFTPNRIGEYGGRILFVPSKYNWRAVVATLVGSFAQNLTHVTIGLCGVLAFLIYMPELPYAFRTGFGILGVIILLASVALYFNLPAASSWALRFEPPSWLRKPWRALKHLKKIDRSDLTSTLFLSLSKYIVFSTQFVLLLLYFGIEVPLPWIIAGVAVMYLMQTSIPLPPFVDVVVRSEIAVILWSSFAVNELSVLAASFFIWIINLLIPAFFGLIAISTVNVLQSLGYESKGTESDSNRRVDHLADRVVTNTQDGQ